MYVSGWRTSENIMMLHFNSTAVEVTRIKQQAIHSVAGRSVTYIFMRENLQFISGFTVYEKKNLRTSAWKYTMYTAQYTLSNK